MLGAPEETHLLIEPIIGWRYWDIKDEAFCSPQQRTMWHRGAHSWDGSCRCGQSLSGFKRVSHFLVSRLLRQRQIACHCGINAWTDPQQAIDSPMLADCDALGQVELTGTVTKLEKGWRGEKGRIVRVWACDQLQEEKVMEAASAAGAQYMGLVRDLSRTNVSASRRIERIEAYSGLPAYSGYPLSYAYMQMPDQTGPAAPSLNVDIPRLGACWLRLLGGLIAATCAVWVGGWIMWVVMLVTLVVLERVRIAAERVYRLSQAESLHESALWLSTLAGLIQVAALIALAVRSLVALAF